MEAGNNEEAGAGVDELNEPAEAPVAEEGRKSIVLASIVVEGDPEMAEMLNCLPQRVSLNDKLAAMGDRRGLTAPPDFAEKMREARGALERGELLPGEVEGEVSLVKCATSPPENDEGGEEGGEGEGEGEGEDSKKKKKKKKRHAYRSLKTRLHAAIHKHDDGDKPSKKGKDKGEVATVFFHSPLESQPYDPSSNTPTMLLAILQFLYAKKVYIEEGVFRIGGSVSAVQRLQTLCNAKGALLGEENVLKEHKDPHDVTSLLKTWLKDLSQPLIPIEVFLKLVDANKTKNHDLKASRFASYVSVMPPRNRIALQHILFFANLVVAHQEVNKMKLVNVANVLAPTIMRTDSDKDLLAHFGLAGGCLVFMLQRYDEVFGVYDPLPFMRPHLQADSLRRMSVDLTMPI